jgi:gas vesicle protein
MKRNKILAGGIVGTLVAGTAAFLFWRNRRKSSLGENNESERNSGSREKNHIKKHLTSVFQHAKSASVGNAAVIA